MPIPLAFTGARFASKVSLWVANHCRKSAKVQLKCNLKNKIIKQIIGRLASCARKVNRNKDLHLHAGFLHTAASRPTFRSSGSSQNPSITSRGNGWPFFQFKNQTNCLTTTELLLSQNKKTQEYLLISQ